MRENYILSKSISCSKPNAASSWCGGSGGSGGGKLAFSANKNQNLSFISDVSYLIKRGQSI